MTDKVLKIGIISKEDYQQRTIAIAKGQYRPQEDEPKVWFESLRSMAQVLSSENQELLQIILEQNPESIRELEEYTGRRSSNLSRTLKTMARYGIIELRKTNRAVKPVVVATDFRVEFALRGRFRRAPSESGAEVEKAKAS